MSSISLSSSSKPAQYGSLAVPLNLSAKYSSSASAASALASRRDLRETCLASDRWARVSAVGRWWRRRCELLRGLRRSSGNSSLRSMVQSSGTDRHWRSQAILESHDWKGTSEWMLRRWCCGDPFAWCAIGLISRRAPGAFPRVRSHLRTNTHSGEMESLDHLVCWRQ